MLKRIPIHKVVLKKYSKNDVNQITKATETIQIASTDLSKVLSIAQEVCDSRKINSRMDVWTVRSIDFNMTGKLITTGEVS